MKEDLNEEWVIEASVSWMEAKNLEIQVRDTGMGRSQEVQVTLVMCGEVRECVILEVAREVSGHLYKQ